MDPEYSRALWDIVRLRWLLRDLSDGMSEPRRVALDLCSGYRLSLSRQGQTPPQLVPQCRETQSARRECDLGAIKLRKTELVVQYTNGSVYLRYTRRLPVVDGVNHRDG